MVFLTSNANVADEGTEGRANEMKVEIILANVEAGKIALPVFQPANGLKCSASDQAGVTRNPLQIGRDSCPARSTAMDARRATSFAKAARTAVAFAFPQGIPGPGATPGGRGPRV